MTNKILIEKRFKNYMLTIEVEGGFVIDAYPLRGTYKVLYPYKVEGNGLVRCKVKYNTFRQGFGKRYELA